MTRPELLAAAVALVGVGALTAARALRRARHRLAHDLERLHALHGPRPVPPPRPPAEHHTQT